jgi:hypothetical protein
MNTTNNPIKTTKKEKRKNTKPQISIPCMYLPYAQGSSKVMIYFHGNAEDIGLATELLDYVRALLRVS